MSRWIWFLVCSLLGLVMLVCGWLVPAHLRAVDVSVIQRAGGKSPALVDLGAGFLSAKNLGAAQLICLAANQSQAPGRQKFSQEVAAFARQQPALQVLGSPEPQLEELLGVEGVADPMPEPIAELVLRTENREPVLQRLRTSLRPSIRELLRLRELTNTVIFPPSLSASGQALDTAISTTGLLLESGAFNRALADAIFDQAAVANRGGNPQHVEQILLDVLSLAQRFNWGQLTAFVQRIDDAETLRLLTHFVRKAEGQLPVLFAAVTFSGQAGQVTGYLMHFSRTGLDDLGASLRYNASGLKELLQRQQRLYHSRWRQTAALYDPFGAFFYFAVDYCWLMPWFALSMKFLFYVSGGFLLALALHYRRRVPALEQPLQVSGFHFAREFLFGLGFLVAILLLSEPFLSQDTQKVEFPFRLRLPMVGGAVAAATSASTSSFMNQLSLLTLGLFFVIQSLIYTACLIKLAEIRRQPIPARMKLKLLENEDHLFDAGLYLGFVGTIISLILVSLGVIKPSLMAAYSSTSFGIIFVSFFKIFHLRPLRRKLLMESEAIYPDHEAPAGASTLATRS